MVKVVFNDVHSLISDTPLFCNTHWLHPLPNVTSVSIGMVWYGMVWYGMVWYGMVWYTRV